jgi:PAS domain-containing protein
VESSDDAIVGMTLYGIITSWNAGAERLYGYTGREVFGRWPIGITIPEDELLDPFSPVRSVEDLWHSNRIVESAARAIAWTAREGAGRAATEVHRQERALLLQVYSRLDLWDGPSQARFVEELRTVDPDVTGQPVVAYESTRLIERT